ncbi:hypothetical protein AVEN_55274-1 [Araneus ventricosus]|uniref:Uncharacterized protein n=1 Tax=Araneus ventricosus TaxID=182803 RepID=A0A4Y2D6N1_ARAVE|nr:hypothetical protein AVEN_55274-1 [Araneus ventricosus]
MKRYWVMSERIFHCPYSASVDISMDMEMSFMCPKNERPRAMLDYTYENFPTIKRRRDVSTIAESLDPEFSSKFLHFGPFTLLRCATHAFISDSSNLNLAHFTC